MPEPSEPGVTGSGGNRHTAELRGVLLLVGALFFFAALDATSKHLAQTYAVPLLVWVRYAMHCLLMMLVLAPRMGRTLLIAKRPGMQILRGAVLLCCSLFGVRAFSLMPLAETTAIAFLAPLIVALLAGPWLGEKLDGARWLAVGMGLLGVTLIARPGGDTTPEGIVYALGAACCLAVYQLLTRQYATGESTVTMLFYTALVGTLTMTLALPWYWGIPLPSSDEIALMAALGVFAGGGHWLMILALRQAPASLLAPFMYLQIVWASLLGASLFGHWPDLLSLLGIAIIAGSGLFLAARTRRSQRGRG